MYTTIEPRLIALLNNDAPSESYSTSPSLELPPLHDPNILKASGRPLLLEPDASKRNGKPSTNPQLKSSHPTLIASLDEEESKSNETKKKAAVDRTLGNSSPQSLRKILDDDLGNASTSSSKKRNIVESSKDDFVQLPQPPKKQKAAKQVVPPIIIGLFEPPPQAALFPPIASSSFHDSHGRNSLNTVPLKVKGLKDTLRSDESPAPAENKVTSMETLKRDVKARKKWTEEETNNLLLGVSKHGIGRWTDILEDPSFSFNNRSGVDLKDRFRTCCPAELRGKSAKGQTTAQRTEKRTSRGLKQGKSKSSLMSENILIDEDEIEVSGEPEETSSTNKSHKSRAHRKKLEDLAQLGIEGPFRKSQRRERKAFSEQDDREILMGYELYGPAWTRIQRDPRFHLQNRQPTDLRDRFRNKYPGKFRSEDTKDLKETKEFQKLESREKENTASSQSTSTLQPSLSREGLRIEQIITSESDIVQTSKILPPQAQMPNYNFSAFPEQPVEFTQSLDWGNGSMTAPFSGNIGEMDISRLLLDESWIDTAVKERTSLADINSIITSSSDTLPQVPSFLNMMVSDEQMNIETM
jgi:hypothetical protein